MAERVFPSLGNSAPICQLTAHGDGAQSPSELLCCAQVLTEMKLDCRVLLRAMGEEGTSPGKLGIRET